MYFTEQTFEGVFQADIILEKLKTPENKLYLDFLAYVLPLFNTLNILMQSEKPQIHKLYKEVTNILKTFLDCFIKPDVLKKNIYEIDYNNPRNFLDINDMYFGAAINASHDNKSILNAVKIKCLDFYIEAVKQVLLRFPVKDSIVEKFQYFDPEHVKAKPINSISDLTSHFPNIVNPNEIQDLDNEWRMLRSYPLNDFDNDILLFWKKIALVKIGDDSLKFPGLVRFVFQILCLPHSSAAVERIFSQINLIKTQLRNKLKVKTIEGILYTKSLLRDKNCYDFFITNNMIKKLSSGNVLYSDKKEDTNSSDTDE